MRVRRQRDGFLLEHAGERWLVRRRLDQGRGFALLTWWGGFVANCTTLAECEALVEARAGATRPRTTRDDAAPRS